MNYFNYKINKGGAPLFVKNFWEIRMAKKSHLPNALLIQVGRFYVLSHLRNRSSYRTPMTRWQG